MTDDRAEVNAVAQRTLAGDEVDVEPIECEIYDICERRAKWEITTLVYDGGGWVGGEVIACQRCAEEIVEPEPPEDADDARNLSRTERLKA